MRYVYGTGVIVPFVKKHSKKMILAVTGLFVSTFAVMSFSAMAASPTTWRAVPGAQINFTCGIYSPVHTLDKVVNGVGGNFTGKGHFNPDSSYTWDMTGKITGSTFTFTILYTGSEKGSVYDASNGLIKNDGSATATVSSATNNNCQSLTMPAGSFTRREAEKETEKQRHEDGDKKDDEEGVVANYVLNSADQSGINIPTKSDAWYKVTVSGTWTNRSVEQVDSECTSYQNGPWMNAVTGGFSPDLLDVQINNGFVDWGTCDSVTNTYTHWVHGTGTPMNLRVFDGDVATNAQNPSWFGDNIGSLQVKVVSFN
jgi:hypothetical protein